MDPDHFDHIKRIFENRGMQEWIRNLQCPETQRWMKDLQSSGMRAWMKNLPRSGMEEHLRNFQRPEMQGFLQYVQRPESQQWMKDLLGVQNMMERELPIATFRLPPSVFAPPLGIDTGLARAVVDAAKSTQATHLGSAVRDFAKSVNVSLPTEALASAQYSALRHAMEVPAWASTINELTRSPLTEMQARYVETMREVARLLSDETTRRLMELAEPADLIEEGIDTAEGLKSPLQDVTAEEGVEYMGLDMGSAVDALLPMLQWTIVVLSVAWTMASSNPMYAEYKDDLTAALTKLYVVERVLKWHKENAQEHKAE